MDLESILNREDIPSEIKQIVRQELEKAMTDSDKFREERKMMEETIIKNEGLYSSFVHNFQGIAFRGKMDFTPIFFHGNVEEITGYTEEDFTSGNLKWNEVIYPDDLELINSTSKKLLTEPKYSVGREYRIINKNGQITWIYERIQNMTDSTGKTSWLQGVIFDNSYRKEVEAALQKSEEQYRMLVEKMEEGVLLEDSEGRIKFTNPKTERMLGYDKNELIGKHWTSIIPIEELEHTQMESLQRSKGIGSVYESVLSTKTGKLIPVIVTATPIFSSDDIFDGVLTVFTDITYRKKLEIQMEEFGKRQKEFIDQTTHELKTPLTILRGYTEILLKREGDEERLMIFETMLRNIKRLEELSEGVSDIYKLERGMFEVSLNKINFQEFLMPSIEPYFKLYSGQIHFESVDKKPFFIQGDTSRLLTVINNILNNSIKNTSRVARTINISLERVIDQLQLEITDNGAGIDPIHIDRIFDKFVSFPTSFDVRGTGIGLYLSREIIKAHNGTITAESEGIGKGTTISIRIPLIT
ncbi:MAG: PAS domain S-box protein [Candidatus Hodarchaeales archaeon]|jgi:PAS domain S-box-containing protein